MSFGDALWQGFILFIGLASLAFVAVILYIRHMHRKYAHIPGPPRKSFFLGHVANMKEKFGKGQFLAEILLQWAEEFGHTYCLFALHRPLLFTCHPEAVKELLIGNHCKPRIAYEGLGFVYNERFTGVGLVTEINHNVWKGRRNLMNPAFHRKVLKGLMTEFNQTSDDLMKKLCDLADGKTMVSLCDEMHRTTLDVIGKVAFGKDIDSVNDDQSPFPSAVNKALKGCTQNVRYPFEKYLPINLKFKREVREACRLLRKTGQQWITEREEAIAKGEYVPEDIMTYVIQTKDKIEGQTIDQTLDDFVTLFIAGHETTANTLAFLLMEVGRRPEIFEKLQQEIDSTIGQKAIIEFDDLGNLEYASMLIKETLRLYPPVSATFRDTSCDVPIQDYLIPTGTMVVMSPYVSGRASELHEDALTFYPERFKQDSPQRPTMYTNFPFSLGTRNCIGQTFAQIESKVILAKFIQHFEFKLDPNQSFDVQDAMTLSPKGGTMATLTLRSQL